MKQAGEGRRSQDWRRNKDFIFCLSVFAFAVLSAWNALPHPQIPASFTLHLLQICSNVIFFMRALLTIFCCAFFPSYTIYHQLASYVFYLFICSLSVSLHQNIKFPRAIIFSFLVQCCRPSIQCLSEQMFTVKRILKGTPKIAGPWCTASNKTLIQALL